MKVALIQMKPQKNPTENIKTAISYCKEAKKNSADIAVLPEMFFCLYENEHMKQNAIEENHPLLLELKETANSLNLYIVAGSIPEKIGDTLYNTSFVFDPSGNTIAKHRKIHLFDINVKNGQYYKESDVFSAGNSITTFDTPFGKFGIMICYDIRFPELARLMSLEGVLGIFVPAAFNHTTGPAHWNLSFRARALDNQIFMAGVSVALDETASYKAWGHSISTNPWGSVLLELDQSEQISFVEWDLEEVAKIREQLPLLAHRRTDLYQLSTIVAPETS